MGVKVVPQDFDEIPKDFVMESKAGAADRT